MTDHPPELDRSRIPPPPPYPPPPPAYAPPVHLTVGAVEPPRRSRSTVVVLAVAVALLVLTTALAVPLLVSGGDPTEATAGGADLSDVKVYDDLEVTHTPADVNYPQSPPVGGPHAPVWLDCGAYAQPVREENAVHDLEHGAVWISYAPDLDADDVSALAGALPQNGIMAPYPGLDAPVVVTVWGRQLELTGADDPRLALFIRTFGGGETAPEPFASCAGGVRDPGGDTGTAV